MKDNIIQTDIFIHGGAGTPQIDLERLHLGVATCTTAAETRRSILLNNGTTLDGMEAAVRLLKDSKE